MQFINKYMISFCTQIKNRKFQLQQTLDHNLRKISNTDHQWVIVDCGSTDGTLDLLDTISSPNVKIIKHSMKDYDIAIAKNIANRYADGSYLFNLDCDNFINNEIELIQLINYKPIHTWSGSYQDGSFGRIGCSTKHFNMVGGYYECKNPVATHDAILLNRLSSFQQVFRFSSQTDKIPIFNTKDATIENTKVLDWDTAEQNNCLAYISRPVFIPKLSILLPKNTFGPQHGLCNAVSTICHTEKLIMQYTVEFDSDFDFGLGGKLPGIGAGIESCPTGGVNSPGWSARIMWRRGGTAELYVYHRHQRSKFGDSILFPIVFEPKTRYNISLILLQDTLFASINNKNIKMTLEPFAGFKFLLYHVFRGGSNMSWSSPTDGTIHLSGV